MLLVYLATGRGSESGDTLPNRYLPLSLLTQGTFALDAFPELYSVGSRFYDPTDPAGAYFLRLEKGRHVSAYPPLPGLLSVPVYAPFVLLGAPVNLLEKLSAALIVALSVGLLYLALRRVTTDNRALVLSLAYGLATSNLSVCSQGLWQHGTGQLMLCAALYCLVRGREEPLWIGRAGLPLGLAVVNRPLDSLLVLPLGVYVLVYHRRQFLRCVAWGLPIVLLQLVYNAWYLTGPFDFPLGEVLKTKWPRQGAFVDAFLFGLYRVLFSPARGLLIYSPWLALALPSLVLAWRPRGDRLLRFLGVATLLFLAVASKWMGWWGGHTFGPRLLSDLSPILAFALYPFRVRALLAVCVAWSLLAHSLGAFGGPDTWSEDMDVNYQPEALWSWSNNQLVNPLRRLWDGARITFEGLPTSRTEEDAIDPTRMAATYWAAVWPKRPLRPGQRLTLAMRVRNDSRAVWLTGGEKRGRIRLAWRWFREGHQVHDEGRINLGREIFPGQEYDLRVSFPVPRESGHYGLEVSLIYEGIAWFSAQRVASPQFLVDVTDAGG